MLSTKSLESIDPIYPTPPLEYDMAQGQFLTGLNSEF